MSVTARIDELRKRYEENPRRFFAPLANEYRKAGDLDSAIALCQEHLVDQPGNMNGYVVYGQALFEAARFDDAQATFEKALSLDPENLIALRHLGDMARTSGDWLQARQWYARVLDADPRNEEILGFLLELDGARAAEPSGRTVESSPDAAPVGAALKPMDEMPSSGPSVGGALGEANAAGIRRPTPRFAPATPVVPFREPVAPPPRQSLGLMDLSIDLGTSTEADLGAGLLSSLPQAEPVAPPAAPPSKDPISEAFAESFGVLYEESPSQAAPSTPETTAGFSAEAAPDFSFETAPAAFVEPASETAEVAPDIAEFVAESSSDRSAELVADEPVVAAASADPIADYLFGEAPTGLPSLTAVPMGESATEVPGATGAEMALNSGAADAVESAGPPAVEVTSGIGRAEPAADASQAFVTETMAELYLQQGFRDEALHVYRQLSERHPDDESIKERVRQLEQGIRTRLPSAVKPSADTPAEAMPSATARSFFATLSLRRALRGDGTPPLGVDAVTEVPDAPEAPSPRVAGVHPFVAGGSLDTFFGIPVDEADEQAAVSIASMAEAIEAPAPAVKGQPTKLADTEFSLDDVFRERTPRATTVVARRSQKLRFDQFFTPSGDVGAVESPPPAGDPGSPADLEQFSSWLQGLNPK